MNRILISGIMVVVASASSSFGGDSGVLGDGEEIRIVRDPWGVPHIFAETDRGAAFGHGWAVAEDRLEEALSAMWTANGRRSEIDGEDAIEIDRTYRLMRIAEFMEEAWDRYPPLVRDLAVGYADGMNAYMEAHPDRVPSWAEPVQPSWSLAVGRLVNFWPTLGRVNSERGKGTPRLATLDFGIGDEHWNPVGSNGWAIAAERTEAGSAMLAADPHMPWKYEFRLYEVHLRGETIDIAGAEFIGAAIPVFCRTPDVSWTWTANKPDHADVYRLELDPEDPDRYRHGDEWLDFERRDVEYLLPDGSTRNEVLRWSVHGPVIHHVPEENRAVAAWLASYGLSDPPIQIHDMVRAKNIDELEQAMSRMQFASFNIVAADRDGDVMFVNGGRVPKRPEGLRSNRPLDGSDPSLVWSEMVAWEDLPGVRKPELGFVQNCNNGPEFTTGTEEDPRPETFPKGTAGRERDTVRAWYLRQLLHDDESVTIEEGKAFLVDGKMIPHGPIGDRLRYAWEAYGSEYPDRQRIAGDVERILEWDGMPRSSDPVPSLFLLWLFMYAGDKPVVGVDFLTRPVETVDREEAMLMFDTLLGAKERIRGLLPFGSDIPWGLAHVIRKGGMTYPVETGMYPAISLMNANADLRGSDLSKMKCTIGSAYVALHEMSDPPRSWTVTPIGQTDRGDLPYQSTVTELFATRTLKPLPLTEEQLAEHDTTETIVVMPR